MSTSRDRLEGSDCCEGPLATSGLISARLEDVKELRKGDVGKGRWPLMPPKLSLVGVLGADSVEGCIDEEGGGCEGIGIGARGVVGVVTSVA